jgi:hypothetical protein
MAAMLDVAIGVAFVFLLLSLVCTAVAEALEHLFKYRAEYLRLGIERLLLGGEAGLRERLYQHPLVASLYMPSRLPAKLRTTGPSYIPSRVFALALIDLVTGAGETRPAPPAKAGELLAALDANAAALPPSLVSVIRTLAADVGDDLDRFKAAIERWFDDSMDRVAGWYKRRAQFVSFVLGVVVAVGLNADTLVIVRTLSNDSVVRASVVAAVERAEAGGALTPGSASNAQATAAASPASTQPGSSDVDPVDTARQRALATVENLGGLGIPIGWRSRGAEADGLTSSERIRQRAWPGWPWSGRWGEQLATHLLGWLLTAFALSLGAPFWFDLLSKFMMVRASARARSAPPAVGGAAGTPAEPQTVRIEIAPPRAS